jgi:hypothetical protein
VGGVPPDLIPAEPGSEQCDMGTRAFGGGAGPGCWRRGVTALLAAGAIGGGPARAQEWDLETLLPTWTRFVTFKTGAGYKDNVLFSEFNREPSPFVATGLEFFGARLPEGGRELNFFLSAEDTRYLAGVDVDSEQLVFSQVQLKQEIDSKFRADLGLEYLYQNQVVDVSVTEANLDIVQVRGHALEARPGLHFEFEEDWSADLELPVHRQFFQEPLDGYWESGPKFLLKRTYGHQSEIQVSYEYGHRDYDHDENLTLEGQPIPRSSRAFHVQEARLAWRHYWDAGRRWRSSTRLSWKRNQDNGSGYFDFNRYQASHQFRFKNKLWDCSAEGRISFYDYDSQTVSPTDLERRRRTEVAFRVRAERKLTHYLRAYAEYERERVASNIDGEAYTVNVAGGGLLWEF